ncbi:helix-turn-helix domain-containing protein [Oceanibium sediminis]|uniref:helix-turn-helix domain-containing protein n=1 Tax=Oceanibium sediminis TaxID=2026339 RepID=UPI000DD4BEAA|nr:helix-turn-helix domain-containing protein [Oceanibium sediminis]
MDRGHHDWYYSNMPRPAAIPDFTLFGETGAFPDVVHCERIRDRASGHGWVITPHRHSQMVQVFLLESGHAEAQLDDRVIRIGPGTVLYIPAQTVHGFAFAPGTEGFVMSFPLPLLGGILSANPDVGASLAAPIGGMAGPRLVASAALLADTLAGTATYRATAAIGLAQAMLAAVAELGAPPGTPETGAGHLRQLEALMKAHMGDGWRPGDYAAALSISTGHLSRLCRAAAGVGANAYIERATMTEASRLLAFTRLPVAVIGYRLGFADPAYFSRRFRVVQGLTPTAYRAAFLG